MRSKRIGVDLRCLPIEGTSGAGIAHATREIWEALLDACATFSIQLIGFAPYGAIIRREEPLVWLPDASGTALRKALQTTSINGLFIPSGAVAWGIRVPVFPWVHDLAIFEHPEWFPQSWLKRQLTTQLYLRGLRQAKHLFAVSEDTKRTIERIARISSQKITVTYQGSTSPLPLLGKEGNAVNILPLAKGELEGVYVLILGTVEPRKNISFILNLWPEVERRLGQSVQLVIAGQDGWGSVSIGLSASIKRLKAIDDEMRDRLIRNASVVLIPSLYEGFGRVALEAMRLGTPVIVSDRGALPEVVGGGGRMIPLDRPSDWIEAILHIVSSSSEREKWIERGKEQARKFSWETVAKTILAGLSQHC